MQHKNNTYILMMITFLQGMVFYASIATLYRNQAGITLKEISVIESLSYVLTILFEIPWGIIADHIGYKKSIIICNFLYFISKIVFYLANDFNSFLFERLILSFVYAGLSGIDAGMLYLSDTENSQKNFGISQASGTAGMLIATLIYTLFIKENYQLAGFLTIIPYGIAAFISLFLTDIKEVKKKSYDFKETFDLFKQTVYNKTLILLILSTGLFSEAIHMLTVFLNQPLYKNFGMTEPTIAAIYFLLLLCGLFSFFLDRILDHFGDKRSGVLFLSVSVFATLLICLTHQAILVVVMMLLNSVMSELFIPLSSLIQQKEIKSERRATIISIHAVIIDIVAALSDSFIGIFCDYSLMFGIRACLFLMIAALFLYFCFFFYEEKEN